MARYVNRKHGLVIGSGDEFSTEQDGKRMAWRAVVWARSYSVTKNTLENCGLRTPAQQLMFGVWTLRVADINSDARAWLERNVGEQGSKWEIEAKRPAVRFYFKKRQDASNFALYIENNLKGICFRG